MKLEGHRSIQEVAELAKGYPLLVRRLCEHYAIRTKKVMRFTFIAETDVQEVIWRVDEWKRRPRMARPARRVRPPSIAQLV